MSFDIDICRVCLQNGANTSIFNSNGSEQFYVQIMSCAQIEVWNYSYNYKNGF